MLTSPRRRKSKRTFYTVSYFSFVKRKLDLKLFIFLENYLLVIIYDFVFLHTAIRHKFQSVHDKSTC